MRVFYLLAIVFVVDGHTTNGHLFEMNGLFRYYSFHLMMFAFGSGYFFKLYGGACSDLAHRAKKLLVPLYLWNAVYGVGAALLRRFGGFELGAPLSPYTLLLAPITDGEHFVWNLGAWFIFPLFCAQAAYALIRRLSRADGTKMK
ncbi:MAG: acyltransferase family protein [Christensenellales bacterium]